MTLLGVNIDHVATLRNVRGTLFPCPVEAALLAEAHGADGITAHLREDRRHIKDKDIYNLKAKIQTRLNMEMANTSEMLAIALDVQPHMVTIVPERREELTTEGGLDILKYQAQLKEPIKQLRNANIEVSLFIEPSLGQVEASHQLGATMVEFHTGRYCEQFAADENTDVELKRLHDAAQASVDVGMVVNAGHGLNRNNVTPILTMPGLHELNIGHSLVADAVFMGLGPAVKAMKTIIH